MARFLWKIKLPEKYGIFSLFLVQNLLWRKSSREEKYKWQHQTSKTPQTSNTVVSSAYRFQSFLQPLPSAIWGHSINITDNKPNLCTGGKVNTEHIQNTIYPRRHADILELRNMVSSHITSLMNNCWLLCFLIAIQMMN